MNELMRIPAGMEDSDYALSPVPEGKRIGWGTQGLIWAGTTFCLPMFTVGGTLASAMRASSFLITVLFGTVVAALLGFLAGAIGAKTHLSSGFNARFTLGVTGGKIFSLILAVSLFGWFGFQCHNFAQSVVSTLTMFGFHYGSSTTWAIVGGLLMILTATAGLSGFAMFSSMGVPLMIALALAAAFITAGRADASMLRAASAAAAGGMSLPAGITLVVGSYIAGSCITADIARFSKTRTDTFWGCFLGHMTAFPMALLMGGFFQYAYGESNPCLVMFTYCGMAMFTPFVLVVSIWAINNYNLYCAVLGILNTLDGYVKLPQWLITLLAGIISTLLGALGIMDTYTSFLSLLGVLIPPIAAVIIADYYLYNRNSSFYTYENAGGLRNFRVNTCLSAAVGAAVGLLCNYAHIPFLTVLCAFLPSSIVAMLASVTTLALYNACVRSR